MGVTINFQGQLKSHENYSKLIQAAKAFAFDNNFLFEEFVEQNKTLLRVKNEEDWDYKGATKGIKIDTGENCEPLNLEFDDNLYIQEYCKTQFAEISTHILIIDFLRQIESLFDHMVVDDEGEYWETNDTMLLKHHFDNCFKTIEELKKEEPKFYGPYRQNDGRIIDLMS